MKSLIREVISQAITRLKEADVPDAETDVWKLMDEASRACGGQGLGSLHGESMSQPCLQLFETWTNQRELRQPVAQIIGKRWFYAHEFEVNADVLDPRPESELLVTRAIACEPSSVLDLGVGSGCLLLSILTQCSTAQGMGVDWCEKSLHVARRNATRLNCQDRAQFCRGHWFDSVSSCYDVIVANPPYISDIDYQDLPPDIKNWEPKHALTSGGDGLQSFRKIAPGVASHLNDGGHFIVEIGVGQSTSVESIFCASGLKLWETHQDLDGRVRALEFILALN